MTDRANGSRSELDSAETGPEGPEVETIEAYETDDGVVLYDAQNPLAWVQSSSSTTLDDAV